MGVFSEKYGNGDILNDILNLRDPVFSPLVEKYVIDVKNEQAKAIILRTHIQTMFIGRVRSIALLIEDQFMCLDLEERNIL